MPKVSVIMPVFNCEETVAEAIDSVMTQTFQDFELIICDDCCTDSTPVIVKKYIEKYNNQIILIKNETNSKLHYSLNHCLEVAKGEYIARMDGDDLSLPTRFEKQVKFLDDHPEYDEVGSSYSRFDEHGDFGIVLAKNLTHDRNQMKRGVPSCHACIMMRKAAYDKIGGYTVSDRTQRCEDVDMWYKFYAAGMKGANLQEVLYKVRDTRKALKRRKFKYDVDMLFVNINGFKMLDYPWYCYPLVFRQIISHFVPYGIKARIRTIIAKKSMDSTNS